MLCLSAAVMEGSLTGYTGLRYASMHWYRKPIQLRHHLAEAAADHIPASSTFPL